MFSPTLRSKPIYAPILPSLQAPPLSLCPATSPAAAAADIFLTPTNTSVLLLLHLISVSTEEVSTTNRITRLLHTTASSSILLLCAPGEVEVLQNLVHERFPITDVEAPVVQVLGVDTAHEIPAFLVGMVAEFTTAKEMMGRSEMAVEAAMLLPLVSIAPPLSSHAVLVLYQLFHNLKHLAEKAEEVSLQVLGEEAQRVLGFLEEELVVGDDSEEVW